MTDRTEEFEHIFARAVTVFGGREFTFTQLCIETTRRNEDIREALDALVGVKRLEKIGGIPVTYRVVANG